MRIPTLRTWYKPRRTPGPRRKIEREREAARARFNPIPRDGARSVTLQLVNYNNSIQNASDEITCGEFELIFWETDACEKQQRGGVERDRAVAFV